jgi:hypothetical protein
MDIIVVAIAFGLILVSFICSQATPELRVKRCPKSSQKYEQRA